MAAGGNESGHMEQAGQDCKPIASFILVLLNPVVWITLGLSKSTMGLYDWLMVPLSAIMGLWTGWVIVWIIQEGIPWVFRSIYNYLKYRVQLYKWKKRNPYRLPS